jgi:hypothetical protein
MEILHERHMLAGEAVLRESVSGDSISNGVHEPDKFAVTGGQT